MEISVPWRAACMSLRWLRLTVFQYPLFNVPVFRDIEALHEVSGVKVPRPASPFITHETSIFTRRDGGCCISWQVYGWVGLYFDLVWYKVMRLSWPYDSYSLDKLLEDLVCFWYLTSKAVNWMIYNRLFVDRFFVGYTDISTSIGLLSRAFSLVCWFVSKPTYWLISKRTY